MPGIEYSAGDRIGGYVVLSVIGRGSMSVVYKGYDELLNRDVAIKVLHSNLLNDVEAIRRFEREAEAISKIKHKNVAQIYSFGQTQDNVPFLILEYIDGPTFAQIIEKKLDFSIRELTEFMIQAVEGFRAAFQNDVIHRDIKPQNLMLNYDNVVKILDFGLAKILWDEPSSTLEGTIIGTPYYMSPEMASGRPIDHRGDIYSLGATFYHILGRRPVFEADTPLGILLKHTTAQPVPLYIINPQIPIGLWEIIQRMLEKDPNDRYQNYDELLNDLKMELLAIQNRERESADFSDHKEIMPFHTEESPAKTEESAEPSSYTESIPTAGPIADIESERKRRALSVDVDARKKSTWGTVIFFVAFLLVIAGLFGLMLSLYQTPSQSKRKGNFMVRVFNSLHPATWFKKKGNETETEYQRGLRTYERMKTLYENILLYEAREGETVKELEDLVRKKYVRPESLKDGWGNDIIYVEQYLRLIAPGSDGEPDTEDDFVLGNDGHFIKLPEDFVMQTLELESSPPPR